MVSQMKDELKRARAHYPVRPDSLEIFLRYRDHRRSVRKVATAIFAFGVGIAAIGVALASLTAPVEKGLSVGTEPIMEGPGRIVFSRWSAGEWRLFSVRPDGTGEEQVTDGSRDFYAEISPDGSRIVADTELPGTDGLLVVNLDGTERATFAVGEAIDPAWSPDGTKIASRSTAASRAAA